ncbi:acetyl-CoA carboxylase biotin carboxyl carrier protein subunit [bacterium]|nr:acetyl-CoA carboxylase biotin carboxyl carrier protein subunit [bacterium]
MNQILSPMPGKISKILVKAGDIVGYNTKVLIHEAMKMENSIIAGCDGIVKEININEGDSVDVSQLLITVV